MTPTNESQNKKKLKIESKASNVQSASAKSALNKSAKDTTPPPKSPKSVSQINAGNNIL